jgi:hypothetical protein
MFRTIQTRGLAIAALTTSACIATPPAWADSTTVMSDLTAVIGRGSGLVIVTPDAALGHGNFEARVKVNIHDTTPNTDFAVLRTIDTTADGVCTGTVFAPAAEIHTSAGGAGAVEAEKSGPFPQFDLLVRVVGADGTVLQSDCMTITAN